MSTIFLIVLSLAPCLAIAIYIYLKGKHDPEPLRNLIMAIGFGVLAFLISLGLGLLLDERAEISTDNLLAQTIKAFITVGLIEEGSKFIFLVGPLYRLKSFNEPLDGIVYAMMIGMGFASIENILYAINGGGGTALLRMFTAVPAHAVFAVIMGYFIGEAKIFPSSALVYKIIALVLAVFAHGFYDYFLLISSIPGLWIQSFFSLLVAVIVTHYAIKRHEQESSLA